MSESGGSPAQTPADTSGGISESSPPQPRGEDPSPVADQEQGPPSQVVLQGSWLPNQAAAQGQTSSSQVILQGPFPNQAVPRGQESSSQAAQAAWAGSQGQAPSSQVDSGQEPRAQAASWQTESPREETSESKDKSKEPERRETSESGEPGRQKSGQIVLRPLGGAKPAPAAAGRGFESVSEALPEKDVEPLPGGDIEPACRAAA